MQVYKKYYSFKIQGCQNPIISPFTYRKRFHSILKIESAHTKDTPRGSTAMMSLEDSERAKSGKYVGVLEKL